MSIWYLNDKCTNPCRPKPSSSAHRVIQLKNESHVRRLDNLENQLSDTVSGLDDKWLVSRVIQNYFHLRTIICVNDASENVNAKLICETTSRGYPTVSSLRNSYRDTCRHCEATIGWDYGVNGTGQIIARRSLGCAHGGDCVCDELLDK